ncbi:MAG: hypothetical protein NTW32_17010 [Chloroflexi bacterium]|nr:hypothetical protein [Chloroflexota bacterium]
MLENDILTDNLIWHLAGKMVREQLLKEVPQSSCTGNYFAEMFGSWSQS